MLILWLILFVFALLSGYWLLSIGVVTWLAYWYPSYWLFVVAVVLDGYFGAFYTVPVFSLLLGAFVLLVESLKIQLLGIKR